MAALFIRYSYHTLTIISIMFNINETFGRKAEEGTDVRDVQLGQQVSYSIRPCDACLDEGTTGVLARVIVFKFEPVTHNLGDSVRGNHSLTILHPVAFFADSTTNTNRYILMKFQNWARLDLDRPIDSMMIPP